MRSLTGTEIETNDYGDARHIEIMVTATCYRWADPASGTEYAGVSHAEAMADAQHMAGIIARLAVLAHEQILIERKRHGCKLLVEIDPESGTVYTDGACVVDVDTDMMRDPTADMSDAPNVCLTVPRGQVRQWRKRIRDWLAEIDPPNRHALIPTPTVDTTITTPTGARHG